MFPFSSSSKKTDAPEVPQTSAKVSEPHRLDALTGGAFSAPTSGERSARIRAWLSTEPAADKLQEVFKEMSTRDKGAARVVRERLDEIRRAAAQQTIVSEWADKAQTLLNLSKLNIADALAWQRDAAKAGAPLSREPLAAFKNQLTERVKSIEELQHRVQVQREVALLLAQRIEVLSTKPWRDAQAALDTLGADVQRCHTQAQDITNDAAWVSVEARFPVQLENSRTQLQVVWEAFQAALAQTAAAAEDPQAPLPPVPVWADELRTARGLPPDAARAVVAASAKPKIDPQQQEKAMKTVGEALATLERETAQGHGKACAGAAAALRGVLKVQGRFIDHALEQRVHAALVAAGELQGWQRWSADQVREDLVARAEALLKRPEGQEIGGRKMQETLRQLREQWKQADQSAPANHGLWKRFDDACNTAYKAVVEVWLDKMRHEAIEHRAQRQALIDEVVAWAKAQPQHDGVDWKAVARTLHQFSERWRNSGHVGERVFAELQPLWKQALSTASVPLEAARKASLARRRVMIEEAIALGDSTDLRVDAVKELQQRWQAEAQNVPIDRKVEQRLWDAFRQPIDEAFARKSAQRQNAASEMNARDRAVLDAARALEAANTSGDGAAIRAAMGALEAVMRAQTATPPGEIATVASEKTTKQTTAPAVPEATPETVSESTPESVPEADAVTAAERVQEPVPTPSPQPVVRRVVAVRGDDRPGMKKEVPPSTERRSGHRDARTSPREAAGRTEHTGRGRGDARFGEREARGPRLGDAAFRAQREALEHAQATLRKLAAQAHGEVLTRLLMAWEQRDAAQLPSAQELGKAVTSATRNAWGQALCAPAVDGDAAQALLRLEIAAEVPTPAEQLSARRMLQLQLLTQRGTSTPTQTWGQDTASVLATGSDAVSARRLQNALKVLLRS